VGAAAGAVLAYLYATDDGARRLMIDADEARRLWLRLSEAWARFEQDRSMPRAGSARTWPPEGVA
jgi:hypothetical protein